MTNASSVNGGAIIFCAIMVFVLFHGSFSSPRGSSSIRARTLQMNSEVTIPEKLFWRPNELGVQHYTLLGELPDSGGHVNLHLWLTAVRGTANNSSTITLQGFGIFETTDNILLVPKYPHARMPDLASELLETPGFLYLQSPRDKATQIIVNITQGGRTEVQKGMVPFHLEASWDDTHHLPIMLMRVRDWRRYLPLPLPDLLAEPAPSCAGRFYVTTIASPNLAPAAAARLIAWHTQAHIALGFSCEIAYLYRDHLDAVLADAAILQLVRRSQLCLVLVEGFLSRYTLSSDDIKLGLGSNFIDGSDVDKQLDIVNGDNVEIHSHVLLAARRKNAWLLIIDLDEYLAINAVANVIDLFPRCFQENSAEIEVVTAFCKTCKDANLGRELPIWMNSSDTALHPLHNYQQKKSLRFGERHHFFQVKSLVRPDEIVAFEIHVGTLKNGGSPLGVDVANQCGIFILHVKNMHGTRNSIDPDPDIKNEWRWMLDIEKYDIA